MGFYFNNKKTTMYSKNLKHKIHILLNSKNEIEIANLQTDITVGECIKVEISGVDDLSTITLVSSNPTIASISNNIIKANQVGSFVLTVTTLTGISASKKFNVIDSKVELVTNGLISHYNFANAELKATTVTDEVSNKQITLSPAITTSNLITDDYGTYYCGGYITFAEDLFNLSNTKLTIHYRVKFLTNELGYDALWRLGVVSGYNFISYLGHSAYKNEKNPYFNSQLYPGTDYYGYQSPEAFFNLSDDISTHKMIDYTFTINFEENTITVYKNGNMIDTIISTALINQDSYTSNFTLRLFTAAKVQGIYDVKIYDKILSEDEIKQCCNLDKNYSEVESFTVDDSIELCEDTFYTASVSFTPNDATNRKLIWNIEDTSIAREFNNKIYGLKAGSTIAMVQDINSNTIKKVPITVLAVSDKEPIEGYTSIRLTPDMEWYLYTKNKDTSTYAFETSCVFSGYAGQPYTVADTTGVLKNGFATETDSGKINYIGECVSAAGEIEDGGISYFTIKLKTDKLDSYSLAAFYNYLDTNPLHVYFRNRINVRNIYLKDNNITDIKIINPDFYSEFIQFEILNNNICSTNSANKMTINVNGINYGDIYQKDTKEYCDYVNKAEGNFLRFKLHKSRFTAYNAAGILDFIKKSNIFVTSYTAGEEPISISLDTTSLDLKANEIAILTPTITGENVIFNQVTWYSDNSNVATVKDGLVCTKGNGSTKIKVVTNFGRKTAVCNVKVSGCSTANTVAKMKTLNLTEGSVYTTLGYYMDEDGGGATYDIMSYDTWWNSLPDDTKYTKKFNNFVKIGVNECGDHTLDNGLVAKIRRNEVNYPEQWGCVGDGFSDCNDSLVHMFALIKTGEIRFKENHIYLLHKTSKVNPYVDYMIGRMVGGGQTHKPAIAECNNLYINGNAAILTLPDDDFDDEGAGIINLGGALKNLRIENLTIDGNCYTMKTCRETNHGITYTPGSYYALPEYHPYYQLNDDITTYNESENNVTRACIQNVYISNNTIKNTGTMYNSLDTGYGDSILIINPYNVDGLYIEDNKFINYGRWVFAVDLGGAGEILDNINFNRNYCYQQDEKLLTPYRRQRGLGWIDFESKKGVRNLSVCDNYVEGACGFALNGASQICENLNVSGNTVIRPNYPFAHVYLYGIEWYSCYIKNATINNNKSFNWGNI